MAKEKDESRAVVENVLRLSLLGVLVRLMMNAFAAYLSFSESLHTIFIDAALDVFLSVVSLSVLGRIRKKADASHPYGYGKVEYIWNFIQGFSLLIVNSCLVMSTLSHFFTPKVHAIEQNSTVLMVASLILTALICLLEYGGWKKTHSSLLYANLLNHVVDVLVYILGIIGLWGASCGFQNLDWIIALLIALLVGYEGIKICVQSISELCDCSLPQCELSTLKEELWAEICFPLGWDCTGLRSRNSGNTKYLEVFLKVPGSWELKDILKHLESIKSLWKKKFSGLEPIFSLNLLETDQSSSKSSIFKSRTQ